MDDVLDIRVVDVYVECYGGDYDVCLFFEKCFLMMVTYFVW